MIGFVKHFDSDKRMSFKVNDNKLLKKYTKIWWKVSRLMNKPFFSEPVYDDDDEFIKIKIKIFGDKVITNFQGKEMSKEKYKCL